MRHQLVVIAIIGIVLLSGCSMLGIGNNSDVDQPTAQPNTVTGDHEVTSTHDGTAGTQTVSATPTERIGDVVTQPPDSTGGDTDTGTSIDSVSDDESQSDATPRPTDSPSDGETETDSDTATPDDKDVSEPDQNETDTGGSNDTGDNSSDENTTDNESTSLPESGTVLRVHDANIIDIETDDGGEVTVRLIGIDVPQPLKRNTNPEAWGLNDTNDTRTWVAQHGRDARKFTADSALGEQVRLESVRRDDGVVVAQVYVGNMYLNHALLGQGYARYNDDDLPFVGNDEYGEAEYWAKDDDRGIWGYDQ